MVERLPNLRAAWTAVAGPRGPAGGAWTVALLLAGLAVGGPAQARSLADTLDRVESLADSESRTASLLIQQVAPGASQLSPEAAQERYQDGVYWHLVGDHERAAEAFFGLVATGALADSTLQAEVEWYLAESLFGMGADEVAIERYKAIAGDAAHPFRADGVRRLLELYARNEDAARFDALFEREILRGGVEATDVVLYSVGDALRLKGDLDEAVGWFERIPAESPWFVRARYQLGALHVREGTPEALEDALVDFRAGAEIVPQSDEEIRAVDLARLAVGRVLYSLGRHDEAIEAYGAIRGADNEHLADKLHELTYAFLRRGDREQAIAATDLFLATFPERAEAAELRLLRGHLFFEDAAWDEALVAYDDVVTQFTPVSDRFDELARTAQVDGVLATLVDFRDDARGLVTLATPVAEGEGDASPGPDAAPEPPALPPYALAMLLEDPYVLRSVDLRGDLDDQRRVLDDAEAIVAMLEPVLGPGPEGATLVGWLQYAANDGAVHAIEGRVKLLEAELTWLGAQGAATRDLEVSLNRLRARVEGSLEAVRQTELALVESMWDEAVADRVLSELEAGPTGELGPLARDVGLLAQQARGVREASAVAAADDPTVGRIDRLHGQLDTAVERYLAVLSSLEGARGSDLDQLRETFVGVAADVRAQRGELEGAEARAEAVAAYYLPLGFGDLAASFEESVIGADMGAVNVYWTRWIDTNDEREQLVQDRRDTALRLEERFAFLEDKLLGAEDASDGDAAAPSDAGEAR